MRDRLPDQSVKAAHLRVAAMVQQDPVGTAITVTRTTALDVAGMPPFIQTQQLLANRTDAVLSKPQGKNLYS